MGRGVQTCPAPIEKTKSFTFSASLAKPRRRLELFFLLQLSSSFRFCNDFFLCLSFYLSAVRLWASVCFPPCLTRLRFPFLRRVSYLECRTYSSLYAREKISNQCLFSSFPENVMKVFETGGSFQEHFNTLYLPLASEIERRKGLTRKPEGGLLSAKQGKGALSSSERDTGGKA